MELSTEQREALKVATMICFNGRFEADADAVTELEGLIAAALLEAEARGRRLEAGRDDVPEAARLERLAQQLRDPKEPR